MFIAYVTCADFSGPQDTRHSCSGSDIADYSAAGCIRSIKENSFNSSGLEPATSRLVVQCLNRVSLTNMDESRLRGGHANLHVSPQFGYVYRLLSASQHFHTRTEGKMCEGMERNKSIKIDDTIKRK
jgi:hypothetical protein